MGFSFFSDAARYCPSWWGRRRSTCLTCRPCWRGTGTSWTGHTSGQRLVGSRNILTPSRGNLVDEYSLTGQVLWYIIHLPKKSDSPRSENNLLIVDEIFGNMDEIFTFHSRSLLPKLDYCAENIPLLAKTFSDCSLDICKLYRRWHYFYP